MVNPGAFSGTRKTFLLSQKADYAASVRDNSCAEFLLGLQRRYLKRYPCSLPHNQEPTDEWLAAVNDEESDPEEDLSGLSQADIEERRKVLVFRKEVVIHIKHVY
jgi:hypothetical protein